MKRTLSAFAVITALPALTHAAEQNNMRHYRYCEVLLNESLTKYAVYNTVGLNKCPEDVWSKITTAQIKRETKARFVHLNGPRYFVFDGFKRTALVAPNTRSFGGLKMRIGGILTISLPDLLKAKSYQPRIVDRETTWTYLANRPVYELIDPNNTVYVMQSYSIQKQYQNEQSLGQLAAKLSLPKGWKFKTGILQQTKTVQTHNKQAVVIQDDFLNTYQQSKSDLLP